MANQFLNLISSTGLVLRLPKYLAIGIVKISGLKGACLNSLNQSPYVSATSIYAHSRYACVCMCVMHVYVHVCK